MKYALTLLLLGALPFEANAESTALLESAPTPALGQACRHTYEILAKAHLHSPEVVFQAAHQAYNAPTPEARVNGGRSLGIPAGDLKRISDKIEALLRQDWVNSASDPFAIGNEGHILKAHLPLAELDNRPNEKCPNGCLTDIFGLSMQDLRAAIWVHDNDKKKPSTTDPLDIYAMQRLNPDGRNTAAAMHFAVGLHGQKSLIRLAKVIDELGDTHGWDATRRISYFTKLADAVGGHNSGPDVSKPSIEFLRTLHPELGEKELAALDEQNHLSILRQRYPSLSIEEARALSKPFYDVLVNQGNLFGSGSAPVNQAMGFPVSDRDMAARSPLARQLIELDRGTILDRLKVGMQYQNTMPFTPGMVKLAMGDTARGAKALVKAVGDARQADIRRVDAKGKPVGYWSLDGKVVPAGTAGASLTPYSLADLPSHQFFLNTSDEWIRASDKVSAANTPEKWKAAGVDESHDAVLFEAGNVVYKVTSHDIRRPGLVDFQTQVESAERLPNGRLEFKPVSRHAAPAIWVLGDLLVKHGDLSL